METWVTTPVSQHYFPVTNFATSFTWNVVPVWRPRFASMSHCLRRGWRGSDLGGTCTRAGSAVAGPCTSRRDAPAVGLELRCTGTGVQLYVYKHSAALSL